MLPDFDEVVAALRAGERFQIGGGRCFHWHAMVDGKLVIIDSDDGFTSERPCSEQQLRDAIAENPETFRIVLEHRRRR